MFRALLFGALLLMAGPAWGWSQDPNSTTADARWDSLRVNSCRYYLFTTATDSTVLKVDPEVTSVSVEFNPSTTDTSTDAQITVHRCDLNSSDPNSVACRPQYIDFSPQDGALDQTPLDGTVGKSGWDCGWFRPNALFIKANVAPVSDTSRVKVCGCLR